MVNASLEQCALAFVGGLIIALATSLNLLVAGKITGISGLVGGLLQLQEVPRRVSTIAGLVLSGAVACVISLYATGFQPFDLNPAEGLSYVGFGVAGFLVGIGTKLSNGCTSGHGICGIPRLSIRSIAAVSIFLSTAIAVATILSYMNSETGTPATPSAMGSDWEIPAFVFLGLSSLAILGAVGYPASRGEGWAMEAVGAAVGFVFGVGLMVSGMVKRSVIHAFLVLDSNWNPALLFVMGGGIAFNLISFRLIIKRNQPLLPEARLEIPTNNQVDARLVVGAAIFGLGWGVGSLCPGPALLLFPSFSVQVGVVWMSAFVVGQGTVILGDRLYKRRRQKQEYERSLISKS